MILQFFLDSTDCSVIGVDACKKKRNKKGQGKKKSCYRSSFDGFNQAMFANLHNISLLPEFFEYLRMEALPNMM